MDAPNYFLIFLIPQIVVLPVIVAVLKKKLDASLINLAIQQFDSGALDPAGSRQKNFDNGQVKLTVVTHKIVSAEIRERIIKILTRRFPGAGADFQVDPKILGGMILRVGQETADFSLIDRLRKAR